MKSTALQLRTKVGIVHAPRFHGVFTHVGSVFVTHHVLLFTASPARRDGREQTTTGTRSRRTRNRSGRAPDASIVETRRVFVGGKVRSRPFSRPVFHNLQRGSSRGDAISDVAPRR